MQVHQLNFSQNKLYTTSRQLHSLHGLVIHKHALVQKNNIFQRDHKVLRIGLSRKDPHSSTRKFPLPGGVGWEGLCQKIVSDNSKCISRSDLKGVEGLSSNFLCGGSNLVPRAMPVRGLGWHWLWGN